MSKIENLNDFSEKSSCTWGCDDNAHKSKKSTKKM